MADTLPFGKDAQPEYPEVHPRKYLTPKLKAQLALKQNGLCALCGCKPRAFEWDHILELWAGGTNAFENWQGLCRKCHTDKSGAEAKHRAKMNRCRGKAGQRARREKQGSKLKSNPKIQSRGFSKQEALPNSWNKPASYVSKLSREYREKVRSARSKMVKNDR